MSKIKIAVVCVSDIQISHSLLAQQFGTPNYVDTSNFNATPSWLPNIDWNELGNALCYFAATMSDKNQSEFLCFAFDRVANQSIWILQNHANSHWAMFFQLDEKKVTSVFEKLTYLIEQLRQSMVVRECAICATYAYDWKIFSLKNETPQLPIEDYVWCSKSMQKIVDSAENDIKTIIKIAKRSMMTKW